MGRWIAEDIAASARPDNATAEIDFMRTKSQLKVEWRVEGQVDEHEKDEARQSLVDTSPCLICALKPMWEHVLISRAHTQVCFTQHISPVVHPKHSPGHPEHFPDAPPSVEERGSDSANRTG